MTTISAGRRKTINRVLEVSALAVQAYAILELDKLDAINTRNKANAGTRRRQAKKFWVRQWLLRRPLYGQYEKLMAEMKAHDPASFRNFLRMDPQIFLEILERVGPRIQKLDTNWRKALEPGVKVAITLRYLATGSSYKSLQYSFRVSYNTICNFIPAVCSAINEEFSDAVMTCPTTPEAWLQVAEIFRKRWNFPHCVGAVDGKHIAVRKPRHSGSYYYNYKGFFSIVPFAVADGDYKFIYVDIGANGAGSDAGIFNDTELKQGLEDGTLGLPPPAPLHANDDRLIPYFMVGDDAFALKTWLMKPLPLRNMTVQQRVFNYRLSRARRVIENTFGILANRFRCLLTTMPQEPERVNIIAFTCCVLHNLLRIRNTQADTPVGHEDPEGQEELSGDNLPDMAEVFRGNSSMAARLQRQHLVDYVNSAEGSVPWQMDRI